MAMRDDGREPYRPTVPADPGGRLLDLLSSISTHRQNGQVLVNQIRGSIHQMRELQSRLRMERSALSPGPDNGRDQPNDLRQRYGLTRREAQVAHLLAQGRSNSDIAAELRISAHTARHHTQRVLSKCEVHSRAAAGAKLRP